MMTAPPALSYAGLTDEITVFHALAGRRHFVRRFHALTLALACRRRRLPRCHGGVRPRLADDRRREPDRCHRPERRGQDDVAPPARGPRLARPRDRKSV